VISEQDYILDAGAAEEAERLLAQGTIADPMTRRFLAAAGLSPGMRVLDLGSGAGNVALLAAELVGSEGSVVGVDRDPDAVGRAQRLVAARGLTNIEFREADVQTLDGVGAGFDAAIGRFVLMYTADPVAALREAVARVRPGGVVCLHEADVTYRWANPQTRTWWQAQKWVLDTFAKAGVEQQMGLSLYAAFRAAGLSDPKMTLESFVGGGPDAPIWVMANIVKALVPLMERLGIATSDEVDAETLPKRLLSELLEKDAVMITPPLIGAWATVPSE
jgi:ubiquinone/menaquinone biosynthesis C-methylase UbiE